MAETTIIERGVDATGNDIGVFQSANDDTIIQQVAWTDDDGDLLAEAQAAYLVVLYRPHLKCHGNVGTSI
jgi:hypothetical protein